MLILSNVKKTFNKDKPSLFSWQQSKNVGCCSWISTQPRKVLALTNEMVMEQKLTSLMVTHNMKDAIQIGNRLKRYSSSVFWGR